MSDVVEFSTRGGGSRLEDGGKIKKCLGPGGSKDATTSSRATLCGAKLPIGKRLITVIRGE